MNILSVSLSHMPESYAGGLTTMEVMTYNPERKSQPGMWLQHRDGCGYDVFSLSVAEARQLAANLIAAADWCDKQTWSSLTE